MMGNENHSFREDERQSRTSANSEIVVTDAGIMGAPMPPVPQVASMKIIKSSRVHIGNKFVAVTQNVSNTEGVKEMPFPKYMWDMLTETTKAERLSCTAALIFLTICIALIIYFTVFKKSSDVDVAPHSWMITKQMWLGQSYNNYTQVMYEPLHLVIIQHSVSNECSRFVSCAAELRNLQDYYLKKKGYDLPYNFIIGNDGRVYEARGWGVAGAHTLNYNLCSLGIGFIGDYRENKNVHTRVTQAQVERTKMLLDEGVKLGYLAPDYLVVGAKDLRPTESPGSNLYKEIRQWEHYDHINRFHNRTCQEIVTMS